MTTSQNFLDEGKSLSRLIAGLQSCYPKTQNSAEAKLYANAANFVLAEIPLEAVRIAIKKVVSGNDGRANKQYMPSVPELAELARKENEALKAAKRRGSKTTPIGEWQYDDYINSLAQNIVWGLATLKEAVLKVHENCPDKSIPSIKEDLQKKIYKSGC